MKNSLVIAVDIRDAPGVLQVEAHPHQLHLKPEPNVVP